MMLTLLTYCYATGVYGSTDIELNMQHDRMIRYLCAQFTAEAEQRIVRAVRADSMAMDW